MIAHGEPPFQARPTATDRVGSCNRQYNFSIELNSCNSALYVASFAAALAEVDKKFTA
jgi:hypothetical protein